MASRILTAPDGSGTAVLGKTLTGVLLDACAAHSNDRALNHPRGGRWQSWSLEQFRIEAEEIGFGLLAVGIRPGDHVAMFMESDVYFCLADMGCLMIRAIDAPIYLTHKDEQIRFVLEHSGSRALFVSDYEKLEQILPLIDGNEDLEVIIVAEPEGRGASAGVEGHRILTLEQLRAEGRTRREERPDELAQLMSEIEPDDIATIIYTSGTTGTPKGVMLSHENISFDALTSFSGLPDYQSGSSGEIALSFLPLTHIFARALHYGYLASGTTVYFTTPEDLSRDLKRVRPTVFASVPRLIEKVYGRILERATEMSGLRKHLLTWALNLARQFEIGRRPGSWWSIQHSLADKLVYGKWREALGGRVKYIIAGGAALNANLANMFAAAGVMILQGYGLTETSPVIAYNRPHMNRAGTVGVPIPGVEVTLGEDNEILTRGPHVMKGYYKDDDRTEGTIDEDGWLHTGDVGEITDDGFLVITDRKKDMFKLSTGKYVTPQPLESELTAHPLIEQAVVVGAGYRFCTALIFPSQDALRVLARSRGLNPDTDAAELLEHPVIRERFQELVDGANRLVDHWSEIKRFALVPAHVTVENGMLTPTMKVRRPQVREAFEQEIRSLYEEASQGEGSHESTVAMDG